MSTSSFSAALSSLEEATGSGTWVGHLGDSPTLWWSQGTRRLLEWSATAEPPPMADAIAVYTEASQALLRPALEDCEQRGRSFDLELELHTYIGRHRHVRVTGMAEREGRQMVRLAGTIQDIDRRKQAESNARTLGERLAEFEERWRMATEGSGLGVWDWDAQTNQVFFSTQWKRMLGFDEEEIGDQLSEWDSRLHPDDREACYADLNAHLEGRTPFYLNEHRVRCRDGQYKWIQDRGQVVSRTPDGKPLRVVGTHTDISERKFLEAVAQQAHTRYQGIFNSTFQFIGLLSPDGTLLEANDTALNFAGLSMDALVGKPFWDCHWWQMGEPTRQQLREAIGQAAAGTPVRYQVEVRGQGDHTVVIDFSLKPIMDDNDRVAFLIPEGHDITAQITSQRALDERERLFRAAFDDAPIGSAIVNLDGRWIQVNDALCAMLGYPAEQLATLTFQDITHPDDLDADLSNVETLLRGDASHYKMQKRYLLHDGTAVTCLLSVTLIRDECGNPQHFMAQIQDLSEQIATDRALAAERDLAQVRLAAIGDGVVRTDSSGRITFTNEAALRLLKRMLPDTLGRAFDEVVVLVSERNGELLESPVQCVLRVGLPTGIPADAALRFEDGSLLPVEDSCTPIRDREGALIGVVFVFRDVSATRQLSQQLLFQATHDALTGLANRREFERELEATLVSARNRGGEHYLLQLDLDHFKRINDEVGHARGDEVLRDITQRMRSRLRQSDLLARTGGDEFALILRDCPLVSAHKVAAGLIHSVSHYRLVANDLAFEVGLSIGMTCLDGRLALNDVLRQADTACYRAKHDGRNRAVLHGAA